MNALRKFLGRVFDIRTGEWDRLLLLYLFAFMLNVGVVWGKASSEALFLKQVGVEILPYMFIADAILSIITLIIYSAFADRISSPRMMIIILVFGAVVLAVARVGIYFEFRPTFFILYLAGRVLQTIVSIHAWTYIAEFYDTRTAKRHFPLIASGSRTSGIAAGLLIVPIVSIFSTEAMIIAWSLSLLGAAYVAWITPRKTPIIPPEGNPTEQKHGFAGNIQEGFKFVSATNFLRLMGASAFLGTILLYLLDFQSQKYFSSHFTSTDDLTAFFGVLGAVADFITLPIQMFILSRIITKLGVGNANFIFPSISALSYALLLNPVLAWASLARINHTALRSAFRTPIDSLLYNAVPSTVKARARAFNGLLIPAGTLVTGILLISMNVENEIPRALEFIGISVALAYLFVTYRLRREYARSLTSLLADDEMNIFRLGDDIEDQPKDITIKLLRERIDKTDDEALTVFLCEMLFDTQGRASVPFFEELATSRGAVVRAGIIDIIGSYWNEFPQVRTMCVKGLTDESLAVRKAALEALVVSENQDESISHDEALLDIFLRMLEGADDDIRSIIIPPLIASGDFYYLAPGVEQLSKWLSAEANNSQRTRGLQVLAHTRSERMVRTMVRYLDDPDALVRRQASDLIDELTAKSKDKEIRQFGVNTLAKLLDDNDETVRLSAVNGLGNYEDMPDANTALIKALGDKSFMVRRKSSEIISSHVSDELEASLELENQYMAESAAFILSSTNHTRAKRRALELMDKLISDTYALVAQRFPLEDIDKPGVILLRATLAEQEQLLLDRFFWLLGALSSELEANNIRTALSDTSETRRANAIEALESLSSPSIAQRAAPLFAKRSTGNQGKEWQTTLDIPVVTKWQALFQFWPRLQAASKTTLPSRNLYLPDDDGWLRATAIYAIVEMEEKDFDEGVNQSPITPDVIRLAIEASTHDDKEIVRETAQIALAHLKAIEQGKTEEKTMLSTIEKVIFLKEIPFFSEMAISELRVLASISEEQNYIEGETIFEEGQFGDALYIIIDGEVALQRRQQRGLTTSIRRLTTQGKREYFAEMSIFDDKPHQYDSVALKPTHLLLIRRATLQSLLNHQPELAVSLLKVLSDRLRQFSDVIAEKSDAKPKQLVDLFDRLG